MLKVVEVTWKRKKVIWDIGKYYYYKMSSRKIKGKSLLRMKMQA